MYRSVKLTYCNYCGNRYLVFVLFFATFLIYSILNQIKLIDRGFKNRILNQKMQIESTYPRLEVNDSNWFSNSVPKFHKDSYFAFVDSLALQLVAESIEFRGCIARNNYWNENLAPVIYSDPIDCPLFCLGRSYSYFNLAVDNKHCFCSNSSFGANDCEAELKRGDLSAVLYRSYEIKPRAKLSTKVNSF